MHHRVGRVMAQKARGIAALHRRFCPVEQRPQKGPCVFVVHPLAQVRQRICPLLGRLPHLIAEQHIRPVGPGKKRLPVQVGGQFLGAGRPPGTAQMGVSFRHGLVPSFLNRAFFRLCAPICFALAHILILAEFPRGSNLPEVCIL